MTYTPEALEAEARRVFEADKASKARAAQVNGWDEPLPHMTMTFARKQAKINLDSRARISAKIQQELRRLANGGKPRRSRGNLVGPGR